MEVRVDAEVQGMMGRFFQRLAVLWIAFILLIVIVAVSPYPGLVIVLSPALALIGLAWLFS